MELYDQQFMEALSICHKCIGLIFTLSSLYFLLNHRAKDFSCREASSKCMAPLEICIRDSIGSAPQYFPCYLMELYEQQFMDVEIEPGDRLILRTTINN